MKKYDGATFQETRAWHGPEIASIKGAQVKLRWTNKPYRWHKNTGDEIFAVLSGTVDMHFRQDGKDNIIVLTPGDVLHVSNGDEHVAHPRGAARILVVEEPDSD